MAALFAAVSSPSLPHILRLSSSLLKPSPARLPFQTLRSNPRSSRLVAHLFTGIVEEIGCIEQIGAESGKEDGGNGGFEMRIGAETVLGGTRLGDSIAVNGTCLTVTEIDLGESCFSVGLSPETLRRTSLGGLGPGSPVNLERALTPETRMGGHFVQGHVDGTGEIIKFSPEGDSLWVTVRTDPELLRLIVPKGFIAVDGTSLTVVGVYEEESSFDFMLVAYTQQKIVLPSKKVGDKVNLEVDILGKYVEKLLSGRLEALGVRPAASS